MKKRIISLLLVLTFVLSMIPTFGITALATSDAAPSESEAVITVEETWGNPGKTVDLNVVLTDNPGILGATITISWDEKLTLVAAASGEAFGHMTYMPPSRYIASGTNFVWHDKEVKDAIDGTILTLTFTVSEAAQNNDILPVRVTYTSGDIFDKNDNDVILSITDGYIRAITYQPGDVTGDGRVNARDLVRLSQYISDGCTTDPEGYNAEVIADACDVNGDGRINARDLVRLSQYISDGGQTDPEGYNAVLKPAKMPECTHSNLQETPAKAAGCTDPGNIAYWHCPECGKYFGDSEGMTELNAQDTIVAAKGHTVVIDEAVAPTYENTGLTEGSHCSVCNMVLQEQQVVPALDPEYYSITYSNLQGAATPELKRYASHIGVSDEEMPKPERAGYAFKGWFNSIDGGNQISDIPAGSNRNYHLYARWELIKYTITYNHAPIKNNATFFTIEDEIILKDPEWAGLAFNNWTDASGNIVRKVEKGTVGNLEITANWFSEKNMAIPAKSKEAKAILFDEAIGRYYFIFDVGTIENIVLSTLGIDDKRGGETLKWKIDKTVNFEKDIADTVAKTISKSISQTKGWSETKQWAISHSASLSSSITAGLEVEQFGLKAKLEATVGTTETTGESASREYGTSGNNYSEEGKSESVSSTVSYKKGISTTIGKEITIPGEMPRGKYSYVCAGTVHVYAVVTYDPDERNYYVDTFSVMDDSMYEKRMYEAPADTTANITTSNGLSFNIETYANEIITYLDSVYTVQYDANGGNGEMLDTLHKVGEISNLQLNSYEREGYTFAGWGVSPGGADVVVYTDNAAVKDIAGKGETITLYAIWAPNNYKITYKVGDEFSHLSASGYGESTDVVFDAEYTLCVPKFKYSDYYYFVGWYRDGVRLTDSNGRSYEAWNLASGCEVYARWAKKYEGYEYIRLREDLENIKNAPGGRYMLIDDIDLSGKEWEPIENFKGELDGKQHTIKGMTISISNERCGLFSTAEGAVICNLNLVAISINNLYGVGESYTGGIVGYANSTTVRNCSVAGQITVDATTVKRENNSEKRRPYVNKLVGKDEGSTCVFEANNCENLSVTNASYARTSKDYIITDSGRWKQDKDIIDLATFGINADAMQDASVESISITLWLDNKDIYNGNHYMFIYTDNDEYKTGQEFWAPDDGWGTTEFTFTLSLTDIINNRFKILYGADGNYEDDWYAGTLRIRFSF